MRYLDLSSGGRLPVLGQGTWRMGEHAYRREVEVSALRYGLDLGLELIDTAEMYAKGGAEEVVGEAVAGRRDEVFLVSKVLPRHASTNDTIDACERSLDRLRTDYIDLYLLHWRGSVPLEETFEAFERLRADGKIRHFGVSNFDHSDMTELWSLPEATAETNQVLYNLSRRGPEFDLFPWCREHGIPLMAYSPIEQGRLLGNATLERIAERHGCTSAQIAVAWVLHQPMVCAIPKAASAAHVADNRAVLDIVLTDQDLAELDREFPPPTDAVPLERL